nr:hypothetical protein [Nocardia yunnanensis]
MATPTATPRQQVFDDVVFGLHLVEDRQVRGVGGGGAHQRPQGGVLGAVMPVELALEGLPAEADGRLGEAVLGDGGGEPDQVAHAGVVGQVHAEEVDGRGGPVIVHGHGGTVRTRYQFN